MTAKRRFVLVGVVVFMLVAGATWAFAQEDSGLIHACVNNSSGTIKIVSEGTACKSGEIALSWGSGEGGGGDSGGGVFTMFGGADKHEDQCGGIGGVFGPCNEQHLVQSAIVMPSDGRLTALAINPHSNTAPGDIRITVLVNGVASIEVEIASSSTTVLVESADVAVEAGDLVNLKTSSIYGPDLPAPYPAPDDVNFTYNASLQFVSD
jgi:hypothetical protein